MIRYLRKKVTSTTMSIDYMCSDVKYVESINLKRVNYGTTCIKPTQLHAKTAMPYLKICLIYNPTRKNVVNMCSDVMWTVCILWIWRKWAKRTHRRKTSRIVSGSTSRRFLSKNFNLKSFKCYKSIVLVETVHLIPILLWLMTPYVIWHLS